MNQEELQNIKVTDENCKLLGIAKKYIGMVVKDAIAERERLKKEKQVQTRIDRLEPICSTLLVEHDSEVLKPFDMKKANNTFCHIRFTTKDDLLEWIELFGKTYINATKEE